MAVPPGILPLAARLQAALGGQYRLGPVLGRGGFGVVFAAEEPALQRTVAIKVLHPQLGAPLLHERFRREAVSAAQLRHPHIIPIYGVGERDGLVWFVMPRIEGESLRERLERDGPLPIGEARRILVELASALGLAHQAGIIHRDVKPDNILLDGAERRAVLTDFGIAKSLLGSGRAGDLTGTGLIVGTTRYMSPEQAGGEPAIGPQADLYSLGVVTYEMLTARLPFEGRTPGGILLQQLTAPPVPVVQLRRDCPAPLARAVERCLLPEPGERWQGAEELLAALGRDSVPVVRPIEPAASLTTGLEATRRFRWTAFAWGIAILAALAVDGVRRELLAAPIVTLLGVGILAAAYGSLWMRGIGWRALIGRAALAAALPQLEERSRTSQARSDRAAILRRLAALPRTERARMAHVAEALDQSIGELERLAAQGGGGAMDVIAGRIARLRAAFESRGERPGKTLLGEIEEFVGRRS